MPSDSRREIEARAAAAGVELSEVAIEELVEHLLEVRAAATERGEGKEGAEAAVRAALAEADFAALRSVARARREPVRARGLEAVGATDVAGAIRLAFRQMRRHPTHAVLTVAVLGLGIGSATAIESLVEAVVLRPLPFERPDELVRLWDTNAERGLAREPVSPVNLMDQRALPVFADAAAWWRPTVNLADPGLDPVRVATIETTSNLFSVLGVRPRLGPGFAQDGTLFSARDLQALISDRLWRDRYGSDPGIVGRSLTLDGNAYTVVGVLPPGVRFPDDVDVWQRLRWDPTQHSRGAHFMDAVARLAPGRTLAEARAACDTLATRLAADAAITNRGWGARVDPLLDDLLGSYRPALYVLLGSTALLLAIGCFNVASLLLTRALEREREIGVRVALGAGVRQIASLLFAESAVLSVLGGLAGAALAALAVPAIARFAPLAVPRLAEATVDPRSLGLALACVAATTLFFGLVPGTVLLARRPTARLRAGSRGASPGARRVYGLLVAGEVALAFALLVGAALLVRTVVNLTRTPTGVDADGALTTSVQLSGDEYADWRRVADVHARILEQIRAEPGVEAAGGANFLPLDAGWRAPVAIDGAAPVPAEDAPQAQLHSVSDGYFETLRARLDAGRYFAPADDARSTPVAIVNEAFVHRWLAGEPAVGRAVLSRVRAIGPLGTNLLAPAGDPHAPTRFEIVGVVADVRDVPFGQAVEPAIYVPTRQFPFREQFVVVRARERALAVAAVRAALASVAPGVPAAADRTWGERLAARSAEVRALGALVAAFGGLAALLAAIGVYGLVSWSVALRERELAIRLALGAEPRSVGRLVLGQGGRLVVVGIGIGWLVVLVLRGALDRLLFGVGPGDPLSALGATAVLVAAASAACLRPARRAARIDPASGLRSE